MILFSSRQNYYDPESWNEEGTDSPDRLVGDIRFIDS